MLANKIGFNNLLDLALFTSPDANPNVVTALTVDMSLFGSALARFELTNAAGDVTAFEWVASDSSDMSTNVTVLATSDSVPAANVGDKMKVEVNAQEVADLSNDAGVTLRYVAPRLTFDSSGATSHLAIVAAIALHGHDGLTPL